MQSDIPYEAHYLPCVSDRTPHKKKSCFYCSQIEESYLTSFSLGKYVDFKGKFSELNLVWN